MKNLKFKNIDGILPLRDPSFHSGQGQNDALRQFAIRAKRNGFTLIEIMLVILIIGVLAAMAVPRLVGRSKEARIAAAQADIESNISVALDLYELDNGTYPATDQGLAALVEKPSGSPTPPNWNGPYLKKLPKDPWGHAYVYRSPGERNTGGFDIYSLGPDGVEGTGDDITNWEQE